MISKAVNISDGPTPHTRLVSGYVCDFEEHEEGGGPGNGGWVEMITREAFERALAADPRVNLLHGVPTDEITDLAKRMLARTSDHSLKLSVDDAGFKVEAVVKAAKAEMLQGGVFGFSFRAGKQDWSLDYNHRVITEINLDNLDIYVTAEPAQRAES